MQGRDPERSSSSSLLSLLVSRLSRLSLTHHRDPRRASAILAFLVPSSSHNLHALLWHALTMACVHDAQE